VHLQIISNHEIPVLAMDPWMLWNDFYGEEKISFETYDYCGSEGEVRGFGIGPKNAPTVLHTTEGKNGPSLRLEYVNCLRQIAKSNPMNTINPPSPPPDWCMHDMVDQSSAGRYNLQLNVSTNFPNKGHMFSSSSVRSNRWLVFAHCHVPASLLCRRNRKYILYPVRL
jgi:hypothetical protein